MTSQPTTSQPTTSDSTTSDSTTPHPTTPADRREQGGGVLRRIALSVYAALFVVSLVFDGMPLDRFAQALWIIGAITAGMLGRPLREYVRVLRDWALFLGALIAYDQTRGFADTVGLPVHVEPVADLEQNLFGWFLGGDVPTVWLQDRLYDATDVRWWDLLASLVYISHFFFVWVLGVVVYLKLRERWGGYVRRVMGLTIAGLATYVLYPAAPPWYAAQEGILPHIHRISTRGWSELGLHGAGELLSVAQAGANDVAAIPSLHAGFSMLVSVLLWTYVRNRWVRVLIVLYPLLMAFTLVYAGEHYLVDVLLGWLYAAGVCFLARAYEQHSARRRSRLDAPPPASLTAASPEQERIEVVAAENTESA